MDIDQQSNKNPTTRIAVDRSDLVALFSLFLLFPAIGLVLTLIPAGEPLNRRAVAPEEIIADIDIDSRVPDGFDDQAEDDNNPNDLDGVGPVGQELPQVRPLDGARDNLAKANDPNSAPASRRPTESSEGTGRDEEATVAASAAPAATPRSATPPPATPTAKLVPEAAPAPARLSAPTNLSAQASADGVVLNWQPVPGVSKYNLYRGRNSNEPSYFNTVENTTSYIDAVAAGTYRYYLVSVGESETFSGRSDTSPAVVITG